MFHFEYKNASNFIQPNPSKPTDPLVINDLTAIHSLNLSLTSQLLIKYCQINKNELLSKLALLVDRTHTQMKQKIELNKMILFVKVLYMSYELYYYQCEAKGSQLLERGKQIIRIAGTRNALHPTDDAHLNGNMRLIFAIIICLDNQPHWAITFNGKCKQKTFKP